MAHKSKLTHSARDIDDLFKNLIDQIAILHDQVVTERGVSEQDIADLVVSVKDLQVEVSEMSAE